MGSQESDMTEQLNMHVLGTQHIKVSISGPGPVRTHSLPQCKLKYSLINAIIEIQPTYMGCAINFPMGLSSGGDICICFFKLNPQFSSVAQSCLTLRPHELQHTRPPCPSPTPGVHSNSCPSSRCCHPAISSSVISFSSCPQSLLASESFPMSQLFAWGGQSTGVSALASVLPKKSQGWSPLNRLVGSPCSPRDSQESSPTPQFISINSLPLSCLHSPTLTSIHDHRKNHSLD